MTQRHKASGEEEHKKSIPTENVSEEVGEDGEGG